METASKKGYPSLVSKSFHQGKKHFFIDVKKAVNDTHFMLVTSSEEYADKQYRRQTIKLWEEDLFLFVKALSVAISRMNLYNLPEPANKPPMEIVKDASGMKGIALEDRPREKLHAHGPTSLDNAELLAILMCTGSSESSVLDLCRKIMRSVKNEPARLLSRTANDLCRFRGVGAAKSAALMAALELGRRAHHPQAPELFDLA